MQVYSSLEFSIHFLYLNQELLENNFTAHSTVTKKDPSIFWLANGNIANILYVHKRTAWLHLVCFSQ